MSAAPTLLRDLIDIPERVQTNDFVLKLSDGVTEAGAAATISGYVVTPQLAKAFDQALGFIQGSVEGSAAPPVICTVRSAPAKAISWRS